MSPSDYLYYKTMFETFGRDILVKFKEKYPPKPLITELPSEDIVAGALKCFILYIAAKENELKDNVNEPH